MTRRGKSILETITFLLLGTAAVCGILSFIGYVGYAHAQGVTPSPTPPAPDSALLSFLTAGQYLPAVGAVLTIIALLLKNVVLQKVAWFQTTLGSYVLSWGITAITYVGTSFEAGSSVSGQLLLMALSAGLAASGIVTHYGDIKAGIVKMRAAKKAVVATLVLSLITVPIISCNQVKAAGDCEVSQLEQTVSVAGNDVSLVDAIINAVMTGGAAIPGLITTIISQYGPGIAQCATQFADGILAGLVPTTAPQNASIDAKTASAIAGYAVLHQEMAKRGWSTPKIPMAK